MDTANGILHRQLVQVLDPTASEPVRTNPNRHMHYTLTTGMKGSKESVREASERL